LECRRLLAVTVTYHQGFDDPVLTHAEVETVYYGSEWSSNPSLVTDSQATDQFFNYLTHSSYMDLMSEYYEVLPFVGPVSVGRGSWTGHDYTPSDPPSVVNDSQIQAMLWSEISSGNARFPNDWQSLYVIFLPLGVVDADCMQHGWGAYHSAFEEVIGYDINAPIVSHITYAVIPWPSASYPPGSPNAIQWQEIYSSHEMAEAITNPGNALGGFTNLGGSWYADPNQFADGNGRELADLAAPPNLEFGLFNGYWVQALWTNNENLGNQRILPAGTTNIYEEGNGKGIFPAGQSGPGFSEDLDPLAGHLPTSSSDPAYSTTAEKELVVPVNQGLLVNFTDPNNLAMTARLLTGTTHGQLSFDPEGSFTYAPIAGYIGTDSFTFEATDGEFQSDPTPISISVSPNATQLAVTVEPPNSVIAGSGFGLTVTAEDASGNLVSSLSGTATVDVGTGPAFATLAGVLTVEIENGVGKFSGLTLNRAGNYVLHASSSSLTSTRTKEFSVTPSAAVRLIVSPPTSTGITAGSGFSLVAVAEDAYSNVDSTYHGTATVVLANGASGGVLSGKVTVSFANGVAYFASLVIDLAGSGYVLQVISPGLSAATTSPFIVAPAPASRLVLMSEPPATMRAGSRFNLSVAAEDSLGNLATNYTGSITLTLANNPSGGYLTGPVTVAVVGGIAVFSGLSVDRAGQGYSLTASNNGLSTTTTPFDLTAPLAITGERVLTGGRGRRKRVLGFELFFNTALNPASASNPAVYTLTQNFRRGRRTTTQQVAFQAAYDPSTTSVNLYLLGSAQFIGGGQIVVSAEPPSEITDTFGNSFTGHIVFTILPRAQGVVG
jgi:hypothetical protein